MTDNNCECAACYRRYEMLTESSYMVAALKNKSDVEMLRVKMCEHIAEGEIGWDIPTNRNLCPSTMAVAKLMDAYEKVVAALKLHHNWHLNRGEEEVEGIKLDMAAEYCDSKMYEDTVEALPNDYREVR